ncbi:hypothetical protein ATZ36_02745 [Candidatus Endomicrobiellum trichonymphae]|uniref:Uncharacterized protein n=1 Tax=Endomicrobium trichonymphae TaxID=1408204 RepID=A0A1E5ILU8_ENDTX|nr:hypothetical protein ATZ36_02745 [Candidatus Endomicrobium trichonymphae]
MSCSLENRRVYICVDGKDVVTEACGIECLSEVAEKNASTAVSGMAIECICEIKRKSKCPGKIRQLILSPRLLTKNCVL